ncbi:MAG: cytochrome P450, partial [Trueperaceae bacterium]
MATDPLRFDPTDPAFLHDPYPTYARLREHAPVLRHEPWGAWVMTRHADVDRLLRDRRLGRVTDAAPKLPSDQRYAPFARIQAGSLLEIEPPDHTRIKQVVHDVFTPKHVRDLSERIRLLAARQAERLAATIEGDGDADLLTDFAEPIPVTVIAELLGVSEADRHRLLPWSKMIIGMFEPERTPEAEAAAIDAAAAFSAFLRELIQEKRRRPQDDLISRMTRLHDEDPDALSEDEIVANGILFLNAGHEAVVNVLGNGFQALLTHPEQLAALRADPDGLLKSTVEEMMRFDTPLQFFERFVTEPVRYEADDGSVHDWPAGTKLALVYAAANRDPAVFHEPERFEIRRWPNPHLAFGMGIHYCIGAPLARLELRHALRAVFQRLPTLAL